LFVCLHSCFCLFEFLFAHSLCLFQTKKQSMIFVLKKSDQWLGKVQMHITNKISWLAYLCFPWKQAWKK
jgi:hypothetical protein